MTRHTDVKPSDLGFKTHTAAAIALTGVLLIMLGMGLSAENLAAFGVMDGALNHPNPMVVETALLEVSVAKVALMTLGALLLLLAGAGPRLSQTQACKSFMVWNLAPPLSYERHIRSLQNRSLAVFSVLAGISLLYLGFGNDVFPQHVLA